MLRLPAYAARSAPARAELAAALDELRAIAHGLFPRALRDDGLQAALPEFRDPVRSRSLSGSGRRQRGVRGHVDGRVPAGDRPCLTASRQAPMWCTWTSARRRHLRVDVEAAGSDTETLWPRRHAADRFAVLAGDVRRRRPHGARCHSVRAVIAEDMVLLREDIARPLADEGVDVIAQVDDPAALLEVVAEQGPDVALIDIKLPPSWTDEGSGRPRTSGCTTRARRVAAVQLPRPPLRRRAVGHRMTSCGYLSRPRRRSGRAPGCTDPGDERRVGDRPGFGRGPVAAQVRGRSAGHADEPAARDPRADGPRPWNARIANVVTQPADGGSHVRSIFTASGCPSRRIEPPALACPPTCGLKFSVCMIRRPYGVGNVALL